MLCSAIWKSEKEFAGLSQTDEERQCRRYMLLVQDLDGLSQCNQQGQSCKQLLEDKTMTGITSSHGSYRRVDLDVYLQREI